MLNLAHSVAVWNAEHMRRNITSSELAFRIAIRTPERAEQIQAEPYDYYAFYKMWGLEMDYDE